MSIDSPWAVVGTCVICAVVGVDGQSKVTETRAHAPAIGDAACADSDPNIWSVAVSIVDGRAT